MSILSEITDIIRHARYGREVREGIADGMEYLDGKADSVEAFAESASASATAAENAKNAAATSATNAATSATNAATSATNAKASENSAKAEADRAFSVTPQGYEQIVQSVNNLNDLGLSIVNGIVMDTWEESEE